MRRVVWVTITTEPPQVRTDIVLASFPVCGFKTAMADERASRVGRIDHNGALASRIEEYVDLTEEPTPPPEKDM